MTTSNPNSPSNSAQSDAAAARLAQVQVAFIGGGNMASAIIGGLARQGMPGAQIHVVDPHAEKLQELQRDFGVQTHESVHSCPAVDVVVWAVKPQIFKEAALAAPAQLQAALHVSVAAGIGSDSIAQWLRTERIVRSMPNTPALIGQGAMGLFARAAVSAEERQLVQQLLQSTGLLQWVEQEALLDAVTAISGSGPAYVFYFLEVLEKAGQEMGLSAAQAKELAIATFQGAASLAQASSDSAAQLREKVTSKGGTTHAAIQTLEAAHTREVFAKAVFAAQHRAQELGQEFGA